MERRSNDDEGARAKFGKEILRMYEITLSISHIGLNELLLVEIEARLSGEVRQRGRLVSRPDMSILNVCEYNTLSRESMITYLGMRWNRHHSRRRQKTTAQREH